MRLIRPGPRRPRSPRARGGLTYPFYLVHQSIGIPVAKGLIRAFPRLGLLPSMAVSVGCALGLSLLIHTTVERRLGRLLRHRLTLYPGPGGSIVLKERDIRDPYVERQEQIKGRGEAWAALIDCLQNGIEVTATTQWAEQVNAILDSVRQGDKR